MKMRIRFTALAICGALSACAPPPSDLPPPPLHRDGQTLWQIVSTRCLPGSQANHRPDPCTEVAITEGAARCHVVLKDRSGVAKYLVMPTRLITGIEDPALLEPGAPNYFAPAWAARHLVEQRVGARLPRQDISVAVNSRYGRSQDLLHLHVDCMWTHVRDLLRDALPGIGHHWSRPTLMLAGAPYRAIRIDGEDAPTENPFSVLAHGLHVPPAEMGAWTLVLVGEDFPDGRPGFVLLAGRVDAEKGQRGSGEDLQDHSCAGRIPRP